MKKIVVPICLLLAACAQTEKGKDVSPVVGSWQLVYAHIEQNDSIEVKDLNNSIFIKIINDSHFAFLNQVPETREGFYGGAGSYTLAGNQYTEVLEYVGNPVLRGHEFNFTVVFKGDTLIQSGIEKVEEAGMDRFIVEKYLRVN